MFSQASVILSTGGGGEFCIQGGGSTLGGSTSEGVCVRGGLHSGGLGRPPHWILRDTVKERAVRILLECNLVHECVDSVAGLGT